MTIRIIHGDCREEMAKLPEASVDSIVCDPPYDLTAGKKGGTGAASVNLDSPYGRSRIGTGNGAGGFMGMKWDATGVAFDTETWRQALRVLRPGGHLLAFGGTRTFHRMVCAIEDAGFELRDGIGYAHEAQEVTIPVGECPWLMAYTYGSGFPKSHNGPWGGTALKPAWEPIVMARKPLIGTVEANWREHGTGALNVDGARVGTDGGTTRGENGSNAGKPRNVLHGGNFGIEKLAAGRWPANLVLSYPENEYRLRDDVTPAQLQELAGWLSANA